MEVRTLLFLLMLHDVTWGGLPDKTHAEGVSIIKRAVGDALSRRSAVDKNFIRFGRSYREGELPFARVSRAAKDSFIRFGRPDRQLEQLYFPPTAQSSPPAASRRGDNFMRFGRPDNFMRFGRKDNFMRFGRSKDNFMRFGRSKDNFMRFGRKDNFMRFGRAKDNFMRFGRAKDNFMRFGRDPDAFYKDFNSKPGDKQDLEDGGFFRLERGEVEEPDDGKIDDDGPEIDNGDLDLQADKPKTGVITRVRRSLTEAPTTLWEVEENSMNRASRDSELLEEVPQIHAGNVEGTGRSENSRGKGEIEKIKKRAVYPVVWENPEEAGAEDWYMELEYPQSVG